MDTASEMSEASHAVIRRTPSRTNRTTRGRAAKMQLSPSELLTGSSTCWYMTSPPRGVRDSGCAGDAARRGWQVLVCGSNGVTVCGRGPGCVRRARCCVHSEVARGQPTDRRVEHLDG